LTVTDTNAPESLCLLRLSAIGDVTHVLPVIATLQQQWPNTRISWIIGATEYSLVKSLPGIEFIVFNKSNGLKEYAKLRKTLAGRRFDILFMMQVSLRANLISLNIKARRRIGFDKARSHDMHYYFCNEHIEGPARVHVLDGFFQFLQKAGIESRNMDWLLHASEEDKAFAELVINRPRCVIVNPCSSVRRNNFRNWSQARYAEVIDYVLSKGVQVILTGGPEQGEIEFVQQIERLCQGKPDNLTGKTTLTQLLALLERADCMIAPDTGPAHMATIADTPAIGLFASSNPRRSGPYKSQLTLVNAYPEALQKYKNKTLEQARWGERVRVPEVMDMISVEQVIKKVDECLI
jgi:heptosyltransferase I